MLIQCTKKLLDELKIKPESEVEETPLFSWHANFLSINRRKTIVFVNDLSRYVIILHGLRAKDLSKLDKLFAEAVREALLAEGLKEEVIEKYLLHSNSMVYAKTKDRTCVSRLNRAVETVSYLEDMLENDSLFNTRLSMRVSRFMVGDGKNKYIYPNKVMYEALEDFFGHSIFMGQAVQLKVSLKLGNEESWRRLVVPLNRTFHYLHEALQIAFDWNNSHLHEYYVYGHNGELVAELVSDDETLQNSHGPEVKLEQDIKLNEYLPSYRHLKYVYDFGDNWEHDIEVEQIVDDHIFNYAICLDGSGSTPPEDVGGIGGYESFLEIMADPAHPEYQGLEHWGRLQGYKEFDAEQINRLLKNNS